MVIYTYLGNVVLCSSTEFRRSFGGIHCLHPQGRKVSGKEIRQKNTRVKNLNHFLSTIWFLGHSAQNQHTMEFVVLRSALHQLARKTSVTPRSCTPSEAHIAFCLFTAGGPFCSLTKQKVDEEQEWEASSVSPCLQNQLRANQTRVRE
jgi:hypothetical protein